MAVIIGSARIDENGRISGGRAGDQTGREVCTENFYVHSRGWDIIRPKSAAYANAIAAKMQQACSNTNIGYDQSNRNGVIKYGIGTSTPTECDCSSLVRACVKEATGKDAGDFYTGNEKKVLLNTGLFDYVGVYRSGVVLYTGDILVTRTKGHTGIVTSGASRGGSPATGGKANVYYAVRVSGGKTYPEVKNLTDYAGVENQKVTDIAIGVDRGSIKYRAHVMGGNWLPWVTGYNWSDFNNGYAGNGKIIDAIQVTSSNCGGRVKYRTSSTGTSNYYPWVYEDSDYAGVYGKPIDKVQVVIE